ncbi:GNAT family N-acetyltransferase [Cereibacter sp. SYSU M97828]|nr:GNAT family N-acetyltransferase [Cereibacter flavus]
MQRHTEAMHADTPPESIHMMDASALAAPGISFFVMRDGTEAVAMGAIKVEGEHAEIKSMHVLSEHRGSGLAPRLLDHLIAEARNAGVSRLSLETGSQDSFAAARALYARRGFVECGPFGNYRPDPNSTFMTLALT